MVFREFLELSLQSCREGLTQFYDKPPAAGSGNQPAEHQMFEYLPFQTFSFWSSLIVSGFDSVISDLLTKKNTNMFGEQINPCLLSLA